MYKYTRGGRQIVEHGCRGFKKQRQIIFDAIRRHASGYVFIQAAFGRIAFEAVAEIVAEAILPVLVQWKLTRRQQPNFVDWINAALRIDIEGADRIDFIAKQIDAIRDGAAGRKQIDQATTNRIFAWRHHLRGVSVARSNEIVA